MTCVVCGAALLLAGAAYLVWETDPLFILHRPKEVDRYTTDPRYRLAGVLRNHDYDSIIVGTSLSTNMSAAELARSLGGKFINAAMEGVTIFDESKVIEYSIRLRNPKTVVWEFYSESFGNQFRLTKPPEFPHELYDSSTFAKVKYVLNVTNLQTALQHLVRGPSDGMVSLEDAGSRRWAAHSKKILWEAFCSQTPRNLRPESVDDSMTVLRVSMLATIDKFPQTQFIVFPAPLSTLQYWAVRNREWISATLEFREQAFRELLKRPNVRVVDVQSDFRLTANFDNYRDFWHYSGPASDYLARRLSDESAFVLPGHEHENRVWYERAVLEHVRRLNQIHAQCAPGKAPAFDDPETVARSVGAL